MSEIPTPRQMRALLADVTAYATQLDELWRWAWPSAFVPRRGSPDAKTGRSSQRRDIGDELLATATSRNRISHAARSIAAARLELLRALGDLAEALEQGETTPQASVLLRAEDRREIERVRAAAARRRDRAERTGDWTEVTG